MASGQQSTYALLFATAASTLAGRCLGSTGNTNMSTSDVGLGGNNIKCQHLTFDNDNTARIKMLNSTIWPNLIMSPLYRVNARA